MGNIEKIKEYWKQIYTDKFDKLDKMNYFIERHNPWNLTKEETDH